MNEESKKIKREDKKKRGTSVTPITAVKTTILNMQKSKTRKISYQIGDNFEPQKVILNPIKVSERKTSIDGQ